MSPRLSAVQALVTFAEAAAILGLSPQGMEALVTHGRLNPAGTVKIGVLFWHDEVERLAAECHRKPPEAPGTQ